jgi:hypothetical protein
MTTRPGSDGVIMLPPSIIRIPAMPLIGEVIVAKSNWVLAVSIAA